MSLFTYTVVMSGQSPSDIGQIIRSDNRLVLWGDPDFQAWNAAQPTPFVLSAALQAIQSAKAMTFAQFQTWWTAAPAAQQQRLIYELMQRALRNEIV